MNPGACILDAFISFPVLSEWFNRRGRRERRGREYREE